MKKQKPARKERPRRPFQIQIRMLIRMTVGTCQSGQFKSWRRMRRRSSNSSNSSTWSQPELPTWANQLATAIATCTKWTRRRWRRFIGRGWANLPTLSSESTVQASSNLICSTSTIKSVAVAWKRVSALKDRTAKRKLFHRILAIFSMPWTSTKPTHLPKCNQACCKIVRGQGVLWEWAALGFWVPAIKFSGTIRKSTKAKTTSKSYSHSFKERWNTKTTVSSIRTCSQLSSNPSIRKSPTTSECSLICISDFMSRRICQLAT